MLLPPFPEGEGYPPTPLPNGKGETKVIFMQGATAPGTPALNRLRRWLSLPYTCPCGGVLSLSPAYTAVSFFSAPIPRPLPGGKGETKVIFMQGATAPCIPGDEPKRHWLSLPYRYPCGGLVRLVACSTCHCGTKRECLPSLSPVYTAFSFCCCPIPPFPAGRGRP